MNFQAVKGAVAILSCVTIAFGAVGCSGKPSKDAVKTGLTNMIKQQSTDSSVYTEDVLNNYVSCVVDGSYDKVSSDTLQKLADGQIDLSNSTNTSDEDGKIIGEAAGQCSSTLTGQDS